MYIYIYIYISLHIILVLSQYVGKVFFVVKLAKCWEWQQHKAPKSVHAKFLQTSQIPRSILTYLVTYFIARPRFSRVSWFSRLLSFIFTAKSFFTAICNFHGHWWFSRPFAHSTFGLLFRDWKVAQEVGVWDLRVDLRLLKGGGEVSHIDGCRSLHVGLLFFVRSLPFLWLDFPRDPFVRDHEFPGDSIYLLGHAHVLHLVYAGSSLAACPMHLPACCGLSQGYLQCSQMKSESSGPASNLWIVVASRCLVLRRENLFVLQLLGSQSVALKDPVERGWGECLEVAKDGQKVPKIAPGKVAEHVPDIARDQRKLLATICDAVGVYRSLLKVHQCLSIAPLFLAATSWPRLGTGTLVHRLALIVASFCMAAVSSVRDFLRSTLVVFWSIV